MLHVLRAGKSVFIIFRSCVHYMVKIVIRRIIYKYVRTLLSGGCARKCDTIADKRSYVRYLIWSYPTLFLIVSLLLIISTATIELVTNQLEKAEESMKARTLPICQKMSIPAYFNLDSLWDQAIVGAPTVGIMIMNPHNGPGAMPSHEYLTAINKAKSVGIRVLGYVHTSYGTRSQTDVKSDIDKYKAWYNVSNIFLDEASGQTADLSYYQYLADYIHATVGAIVMLNFGIYPDESYMNIGDIANVFENVYSAYPTAQIPDWAFKYPPTKFSHLIYGADRSAITHVLALAQQRNVGYIYVTDGGLPNPWNTLPSYWSNEITQLHATCTKAPTSFPVK